MQLLEDDEVLSDLCLTWHQQQLQPPKWQPIELQQRTVAPHNRLLHDLPPSQQHHHQQQQQQRTSHGGGGAGYNGGGLGTHQESSSSSSGYHTSSLAAAVGGGGGGGEGGGGVGRGVGGGGNVPGAQWRALLQRQGVQQFGHVGPRPPNGEKEVREGGGALRDCSG